MKKIFILLLASIVSSCSVHQKSKSQQEVVNIVRSKVKYYEKFEPTPIRMFNEGLDGTEFICKDLALKFKVDDAFYSGDLDSNGSMDYLLIGDTRRSNYPHNMSDFSAMVILFFPNDSVSIINLRRLSSDCYVPKIITYQNQTLLEIYNRKPEMLVNGDSIEKSTLIYKNGAFIEFNENPKKHFIKTIEYSTSGCYGSCPIFSLNIENNRTAVFHAKQHNLGNQKDRQNISSTAEGEGTFKTVLNATNYNEIVEHLNYINFPELNDEYSVNWSDDQACTLTIVYDDNKVKKIFDYGLVGTFGLKRLYQLLFDLRHNQDWK